MDWSGLRGILRILNNHNLCFLYIGRKSEESKIFRWYYNILLRHYKTKYGLEINFKNVGSGFSLLHAYNITINPQAKLGNDVTIFKGATVGSIRSGKNAGVPTIGDRVTICCNAFLCGNITIGNDVLIAANSYVNFDVPDNSIVIGNPGIIKHKQDPSRDYLFELT